MPRLKILWADDEIPDDNIPDSEIKSEDLLGLRQTVKILRSVGYNLTITNKHKDAINLVNRNHFDIAIIDLGWHEDRSFDGTSPSSAGWNISYAVEEADKKPNIKPTFQIIYSRQFASNPIVSNKAAEEGKLPLFKIYSEAGGHALMAAVKFIEWHIWNPLKQIRDIMFKSWEQPLTQQRKWFKLTILFVSLSLIILLSGVIGAIFWNVQAGTLISVSSSLTSAISILLYNRSKNIQEVISTCQDRIEKAYNEAIKEYNNTSNSVKG